MSSNILCLVYRDPRLKWSCFALSLAAIEHNSAQ